MKKKKTAVNVDVLPDAKVDLNKLEIDQTIRWHLYFDTRSRKPMGVPIPNVCSSALVVSGLDERLVNYTDRPEYVEEREAVMLILKKKTGGENGR